MDPDSAAKKLATECARIAGLHVVDAKLDVVTKPEVQRVADIPSKKIVWVWPQRIALGKLSLCVGDAGVGKSVVWLDAAARILTGRDWPDGKSCARGSVVILSAEDDPADTIRPRLEAAGADLEKVHLLKAVRRTRPSGETYLDAFSLERDIAVLRETVTSLRDVRLLIVDPISAYLGGVHGIDSHVNTQVRSVLMPLAELASDLCVAIVCISHLNKGSSAPLYRAIGSVAFVAAARSVWIFAKNPDNPVERLMMPGKMNLAPDVEGMTYSLEDRADVVTVRWGHAINVAADVVLGPETPAERNERAEAIQWLRSRLNDGPVPVKKLQDDAKAAGFSWMTIRRAKDSLGIDSLKESVGSGWLWTLPAEGAHEGGQGAHI